MNIKLFLYLILISVLFSIESTGDEIVIAGTSQNGTTSSDYFVVESGLDLSVDALSGIDYFNAGITGGGDVSLSYNSGIDTFTIGGDSLNITGSFTSFEDITQKVIRMLAPNKEGLRDALQDRFGVERHFKCNVQPNYYTEEPHI